MTLTLKVRLFNDYLMVSDEIETSDYDLDIQGQICHESSKVSVIPCEYDNF